MRFEVIHIVIFVAEALCLAQTDAIDDRRVIQFIRSNRVFSTKQRFKNAPVRIEARGIQNGFFGLQKGADFLFKLAFSQIVSVIFLLVFT